MADHRDAPRSFRRLLVTGGAGFIGSAYVREVLGRRDDTEITVLDKLTYAGNLANLAPVQEDAEQAIVLRTRRYAAYQRKWMRRIPGIVMVAADRPEGDVADDILELARARERLPRR